MKETSVFPQEGAEPIDIVTSDGVVDEANSDECVTEILTEEPPEEDKCSKKYKGFMYIKCPECGKVRGFNAKNPTDHYHCDSCGARTEFRDSLVLLWVHCECGKRSKYLTNMEEPVFDINCLECGAPVAVQWNGKKRLYETIRR